MDRRAKILVIAFGSVVALLLIDRVVYPRWIEPLVTMDQRISEREAELEELQALQARVETTRRRYRDLVGRTGTFDTSLVETDVRDRIDKLIDKHKLEDRNVSPTKWLSDKKTKLKRCRLTVKVTGTLQSAIAFLAEVSELPHLLRVGNVKLRPDHSTRRKKKKKDYVSVTVPLDLWVLPKHRVAGTIHPEDLVQPESLVRHQDRNYAPLWEGRMFWEYIKPKPLVVKAGRDINQKPSKKTVYLKGIVTGGDGEYTCAWTPSVRLGDPDKLKTKIDLAQEFEEEYTLTCADGEGETREDSLRVVVAKPEVIAQKTDDPPPPPKPIVERRKEWKDAKYMQMLAALCTDTAQGRMDQVMIYHNRKKTTDYYSVGDEFDGGELVYVHPTGGLVRWKDDYFIYPIGEWLNAETKLDDETVSAEFPQLGKAATLIREQLDAEAKRLEEEAHAAEQVRLEADVKKKAEAAASKTAAQARKPGSGDKSQRPANSTANPVEGIPSMVPQGAKGSQDPKKTSPLPKPATANRPPATTAGQQKTDGKATADRRRPGGPSGGRSQQSLEQRRKEMQKRIRQLRGMKKVKIKDSKKGSDQNPQEKQAEKKPVEEKPDTP